MVTDWTLLLFTCAMKVEKVTVSLLCDSPCPRSEGNTQKRSREKSASQISVLSHLNRGGCWFACGPVKGAFGFIMSHFLFQLLQAVVPFIPFAEVARSTSGVSLSKEHARSHYP